jgi:hypothetical protein
MKRERQRMRNRRKGRGYSISRCFGELMVKERLGGVDSHWIYLCKLKALEYLHACYLLRIFAYYFCLVNLYLGV